MTTFAATCSTTLRATSAAAFARAMLLLRRPRPALALRVERRRLLARTLLRFTPGDLEQAVQFVDRHTLERAEVRARQRGGFEIAEQASAVATLLLFELSPRILVGTPARQLIECDLTMLRAHLPCGLTVEIESMR